MRRARNAASPLLAATTPVWRSRFVVAGLAVAFAALVGRAAYVQVIENGFFRDQGAVRLERTLELPASRGRIVDRNGQLLASSVVAPSIWAVPEDVDRDPLKLKRLAELLEMPLATLQEKLAAADKSFVWLKRQVEAPVVREIVALGLRGIHQRKEYKRKYPEGEMVAHLVGFTDIENHGIEGAELSFDARLAGQPGSRRVLRDRLGRVVEEVGEELPPVDGESVQLSIDARVQSFAYQKLREAVQRHRARSGSVVVLDSRTGELLALANYPSYDPNQRANMKGPQLRNIAVTDTFEPGSTMKPITVAMALEAGKVTPGTQIETAPGSLRLGKFVIRDTHNYGTLTVQGVIQKSSNIGALKIAQQLSAQQMWETLNALGYGRAPEVAFPGVAGGTLRAWKSWRPVEQATMSYGYGLSASLLQMAHSYTAFAHDGELIPITLLRRPANAVVPGVRVFSVQTARVMRQMLQLAVEPGGTGSQARTVGYSVGGKTGTARKQAEGGAYASDKYRAWFVGMAPIERPRIIVAVMIDEPSAGTFYGGTVAAPVFSEVVQQTLRIKGVAPDLVVEPQIVANRGQEPS